MPSQADSEGQIPLTGKELHDEHSRESPSTSLGNKSEGQPLQKKRCCRIKEGGAALRTCAPPRVIRKAHSEKEHTLRFLGKKGSFECNSFQSLCRGVGKKKQVGHLREHPYIDWEKGNGLHVEKKSTS